MTQEEKDLLLKDLCARLPYGVICDIYNDACTIREKLLFGGISHFANDTIAVRPYLCPMSSMTEEEAKELLFVRLEAKYGKSCAYIANFIKLNEVYFRKERPYVGSVAIWFSFKNKILDDSQMREQKREYSKCEYLGQINDITLAEIDWLNARHFDYRGLIEKGLAIAVTEENNPYK